MKKILAKKLYKKISTGGIEHENPFDIFKKVNYELLRSMKIVAEKIKDNKVDETRQSSSVATKNFPASPNQWKMFQAPEV